MSLIIRSLKLDDKPEWVKLWRSYLKYYSTSLSDEVFHHTFSRLLDTNLTEQNGLIAIKDGKPVELFILFIIHTIGVLRMYVICRIYIQTQTLGD